MSATELLKTPLYALHLELGAKMVEFAGYDMPVNYPGGIIAEHKHCRESAALFDVSHMGQLRLIGDDAASALESLVPVDVVDLAVGKQRYAFFTNAAGGLIDDLMITRREHDLFLVVNAPARMPTSGTWSPTSATAARCSRCPTAACWRCRGLRP
jgi:aminomethyltransferase